MEPIEFPQIDGSMLKIVPANETEQAFYLDHKKRYDEWIKVNGHSNILEEEPLKEYNNMEESISRNKLKWQPTGYPKEPQFIHSKLDRPERDILAYYIKESVEFGIRQAEERKELDTLRKDRRLHNVACWTSWVALAVSVGVLAFQIYRLIV